MTEAFLLLLAAGAMLAAAVPGPKQVTLNWLRLAGIIALALTALAWYFGTKRDNAEGIWMRGTARGAYVTIGSIVLAQLAFAQLGWRQLQRLAAGAVFVVGVVTVVNHRPAAKDPPYDALITCFGVAAMTGLVLMEMLLGHAYLTASKMTMAPFLRLNVVLTAVLYARAFCAVAVVLVLQRQRQVEFLWAAHGLVIGVRWVIGLLIPAAFLWMTHECIKRRATQSATGILYVTGLLILIGEASALYLLSRTGLPF
jgi:hypothetical protein